MKKLNYAVAAITTITMLASAAPAFAAVNSTSINILVTNRGSITNLTQADSHTGDNNALGSQGGAGGVGGNVMSQGSENNGGASAGNGGNGGSAGAGGLIQTGDASADAGSENQLNGTEAEVAFDCECGDINSVTLDLEVNNDREYPTQNDINNTTQARARTGANNALGSLGGAGGVGGEVNGGQGSENNGGASAGTGGAGGAGGLGGEVHTGAADSKSGAINLLNTTILRVRM